MYVCGSDGSNMIWHRRRHRWIDRSLFAFPKRETIFWRPLLRQTQRHQLTKYRCCRCPKRLGVLAKAGGSVCMCAYIHILRDREREERIGYFLDRVDEDRSFRVRGDKIDGPAVARNRRSKSRGEARRSFIERKTQEEEWERPKKKKDRFV